MEPITVDYYTDSNDWYLVADPVMGPTIEIGFYSTADAPELFTQSDQTVGSMLDADKIVYKIWHIYSGAVIDHHSFYRGPTDDHAHRERFRPDHGDRDRGSPDR